MRKLVNVALVLALGASACQSPEGEQADEEQGAGAETRTVLVDGSTKEFRGSVLAYFPKQVTVRQGDTVRFKNNFNGEPHTVTLGTLVQPVLDEAAKAPAGQEASPDLEKKFKAFPVMLPEGPGDANQIAVNPCYIESGALPADASKACPETEQPAFNGKQAYYNSGFLNRDQEEFRMQLADDIAPGAYRYYCNLHVEAMTGEINVVAKDAEIPSQEDVDRKAKEELDKAYAPLLEPYKQARTGKGPLGNVAGFGVASGGTAQALEFLPKTIETKAGQKVTWTIIGPHTITFNSKFKGFFLDKGDDGGFHVEAAQFAPAAGPGQPREVQAAQAGDHGQHDMPTPPGGSEQLPPAKNVDAGAFDGEETKSSGLFLSFPPNIFSYSVTFTKAGTYNYICLIHPAMTGTVKVS
ncbi:MAG TPA: hypothetical protein VNE62_03830 [Actinomycetota bacterium]|nr:hypothetical protein [Actinomycetota bacterium]